MAPIAWCLTLALGARAVSFARPYLYGLAAVGEAGVRRALEIIATSVRRDATRLYVYLLPQMLMPVLVRSLGR